MLLAHSSPATQVTHSLTHSLTHSINHSLANSLAHSRTYLLTRLLTYLLTYSLTYLLTLTGLTSLDLSFNRLESLPSEIYDLPLEHLLVNDNLLTSLPPCDDVPSHRMQNIITLNISNNSISHIPSFGLFISVEKLYGSKNKISLLDAGVGVLLTMTVLDLSYNEITEVPSHLLTHLLTYSSTYLLTHSLT